MASKKKIRVFIDGEVLVLDHFSGIGHYTAELVREVDLLLESDEFSHLSVEVGLPWRLAPRIKRFGFKNVRIRRMPTSPRISNSLKRHRLLPPIDLLFGKRVYVFTHFSSWPTLFSPQMPIIYDLSFILFPEFSADKNRTFLTQQTALSAQRATRIITISQNSKKEIAEQYDFSAKDIDVVVPMLDKTKFHPQTKNKVIQIRAKYSLFDEYILFVGNIEPRKNLVSLLKAYRELDEELQNKYALLLVGAKGWKDGEIHTLIESMRSEGLRIIQPSSYVEDEDLPALYAGARLFAYVSVYEGYGIPPVEAMASGTPVVSSDNSSLPEAVDGAAVMVDAGSVASITKGLKTLLQSDSLSEEFIEKGFKRVHKINSEAIARTFIEAIKKAASKEAQ